MIRHLAFASAALTAAFALAAPGVAQFRLDLAPSAFRAARQPAQQNTDPVPGRMNALSPLGGKQGTPVNKPVTSAVEPVKAYAGIPDAGSADALPGIGATGGKIQNNLADDPNKPRKPFKPNTLKKGVAPRS